ncbi:unnamed protein product [Rotaria sp. Silwood2]|nr:unnamed protein product [Rotaria sp. Silwood2]CAF2917345.1 unnamed protein product [Rotaria sp. Silwood2]CAF3176398.1 unnamed protein product [Rotaria sp. Silwood2]CAF3247044.1 unnamed protein product [Rotaria sp. Silwood2]CAF3978621.1 unnamed protein product [Rotaria sp. Silwood2]
MASTFESSQQSNYVEAQENNPITSPSLPISSDDIYESSINNSEEKIEEQVPISESEETDITTNNINDVIPDTDTTIMNSTNMVTAEASFTEATSADLPLGATRSSVARILVKPGQIFRVQVDNEVKEVHGKLICFH